MTQAEWGRRVLTNMTADERVAFERAVRGLNRRLAQTIATRVVARLVATGERL